MALATSSASYDEYLEGKMRSVLEALVEALLTKKPEDINDFCMEWLAQWHKDHDPEQDEMAKLRAERGLLQERRKELRAQDPDVAAAEAAEAEAKLAEQEEQEKIGKMKDTHRRAGVSAPKIDVDKFKDWVKPHHEKPQEARDKIKDTIMNNEKLQVLFGHLTSAAVYDVIDAMKPDTVEAGTNLINQGEEGDYFYIVDDGTFDVFVQRGDAPAGKVLEYGPGAMFGELALMYNAPRAATVTATSASKVWALDRESFQMMLATAENMKKSQYEEFLQAIELFQHMTKYELSKLSDLLDSEAFDTDEEIMKQGDEGTAFYILEDGEAKAFISGDEGELEVKHYAVPGEFFGEVALLTNEPRRATVRAAADGCTVLSVNTEDFNAVMGPIRDALEKNIDAYPNYAGLVKKLAKAG